MASSHKLSTLYVVDSIVRGYTEEARKVLQTTGNSNVESVPATDGTFASGVYKISELIESIIDDALELLISKSQNSKINKLIDIWERAGTFSKEIIDRIRQKHFSSTTPIGSPPRLNVEPVKPTSNNKNLQDSSSILLALASLAKSNIVNNTTDTDQSVKDIGDNVNSVPSEGLLPSNINVKNNATSSNPNVNSQPFTSFSEQYQTTENPNGHLILDMLQQIKNNNTDISQFNPQFQNTSYNDKRHFENDENLNNRRQRSRSPNRYNHSFKRDRSPNRHDIYNKNNVGVDGIDQGQVNNYKISTMNPQVNKELNLPNSLHYRPINLGFDQTLPQGSFKVLSRTLFIGGVPRSMDDKILASILKPYAEVQSIILNSERKHAFVKVYSRREAEQVITSFNKDGKLPLRTRWGVGFGPRDCCNYQHGISIISIERLTDADKSWVVQAQWGGTGGQQLQSGMVIDEPDIEIGAGISSKAMSKKMPTNSARNGPKSNLPGEPEENYVKTTLIAQQNQNFLSNSLNQMNFSVFNQSRLSPITNFFNKNNKAADPSLTSLPISAQNMQYLQQFPQSTNKSSQTYHDFLQHQITTPENLNFNSLLGYLFQNGGYSN